MRKMMHGALAAALVSSLAVSPAAHAETCRLLVLGAMPVEIGPFLARAAIEQRVDIEITNESGQQQLKSFFLGTLEGNDVIMAMTGIGTLNAIQTTELAFGQLGCISGVIVSGVSGGNGNEHIGDVLAPASWALDLFDGNGNRTTSTYAADVQMLGAASAAAADVSLSSDGHIGDCACAGIDPAATPTIHFDHTPSITIATDASGAITGRTSDPFGGHALACVPGGSDTFGCRPCAFQQVSAEDATRTVTSAAPFVTPEFFLWYQAWSDAQSGAHDVEDMESAAVASVAHGRVPFIAFRSPSDGAQSDPLVAVPGPLGFLPQFLLYRQYAADNAATVALAFLHEWSMLQA